MGGSVLTEQVVVITGCSTGIGRAFSQECDRRGHRVCATARQVEALSDLVSERTTAYPLDVTDGASIARAVAEIAEHHGRIDVLINNAGVNLVGPLAEVAIESFRRVFDTNVHGLLAMTQAVFPYMAKAGKGRIINIGSVVGVLATPFAGPYCASKAAVHALSESLRMEAAPFGIDVVEVQPGGVRSHLSETASAELDRYRSPSALYAPFAKFIEKRAMASQQAPMDTTAFAAAVLDEALQATAPRIVRAGRGARALVAMAKLPGPARDKLLMAEYGLDRRLD